MKKKWLLVIIPVVLILVTIAAGVSNISNEEKRDKALEMMQKDCWALDSTWKGSDETGFYDPLPTKWDCSRDMFGNPKPNN
jgi:hypothetical protein